VAPTDLNAAAPGEWRRPTECRAPPDASADPNAAPAADAAPEPIQADDEALKDLQEALTLAPDDPVALRLRGDFYQATGKTTEAIADYQAALAKDPFQGESRDALEKLGQDVPAEQGLPLAPPVSDWVVTEPSPGRYVATNPKYKKLRAELEMFGSGKPRIIEWSQMKDALAGIGLLRYYAGDLAEGANQELVYTAIIDLWANKVVTIEPYSWGTNAAKWDWQAYSVVVTDPDGTPNEIKLRKPKARPVAREGGGFFDPWGGPAQGQAQPRGRRGGGGGGGGGGLFGWFGR
jgi:tetratricopeptide (TPR) repeat protein